ncbi:MAG TPA: transglycosylase SLT domain-containing protein [Pseudobdellovibrionaceae bacterium]|nr:transglycosylase SLT domain-containing protein [Pseudobdellovibrionaceae bacterium]
MNKVLSHSPLWPKMIHRRASQLGRLTDQFASQAKRLPRLSVLGLLSSAVVSWPQISREATPTFESSALQEATTLNSLAPTEDRTSIFAVESAIRWQSLSQYFENEAHPFWKSRINRPGARIELRGLIDELQLAAIDEGADPFLLWAMAERESRLNPRARGAHGEVGLLQMKPSTSAWITDKTSSIAECGSPQNRSDWEAALERPACNWRVGARYIQWLSSQWYRPQEPIARRISALRAYNIGPTRAVQVERESSEPSAYAVSISGRAESMREQYIERRLARLTPASATTSTRVAQLRLDHGRPLPVPVLGPVGLGFQTRTSTQSASVGKFHDKLLIARSN